MKDILEYTALEHGWEDWKTRKCGVTAYIIAY